MKTISIHDEVHKNLKNMKREGESFSDVIEKLLEKKNMSIEGFFGVLRENPILEELEETSRAARANARFRA